MMWIIAEVLVPYLLGAEKCYKLSNLIKDYSNTMQTDRWTDRQLLQKWWFMYEKKREAFSWLFNLSNFTVNRDKTTLSIKRTLASYIGSVIFIHNT